MCVCARAVSIQENKKEVQCHGSQVVPVVLKTRNVKISA